MPFPIFCSPAGRIEKPMPIPSLTMIPLLPAPRALFRISLIGLGTLLAAQEQSAAAPFQALEELAAKACQPEPGKGVPPQARTHIEGFHAHLGPWIQAHLGSLRDGTTVDIGQRLARELEQAAAHSRDHQDSFWHPLRFQVETPEAHPELVAVTARFGLDATLLLFRRGEGGWKLLWQDRAPAYEDIDGALGSYTTALTPKGSDGAFFLAAAHVTPWYQSNWQQAELRVFRIGPEGKARKVGQRQETIFLGVDNPMALTASDAHHLALRLYSGSNDPVRHHFSRIIHLRLEPKAVKRVPPYADTALDLVDEWLSLPWNEASALVEASARARLKPEHAYLSDHEKNLLTFEDGMKEDKVSGSWEIRAELERDEQFEDIIFQVERSGEKGLRLLNVQRIPRP